MNNPNCKIKGLSEHDLNLLNRGELLPVMEMFYSVQGEGYNTGKPAFFIRIGGCDVGCKWCDVKESWNASVHPLIPVDRVVEELLKHPAGAVVITGGEPFLYNLDKLTKKLRDRKISIFVETSGSYPLTGVFDWICVSPKKDKQTDQHLMQMADELKVVVSEKSDFDFAEQCRVDVKEKCKLYLQPEWSKKDIITPEIVDYVLQNPDWMISLQSHKYIRIP